MKPIQPARRALGALLLLALPAVSAAQLPYSESFGGNDGDPWPAPWTTMSFYLTVSDLQGGRGRMSGQPAGGSGTAVARMLLPGFAETDIEAFMTLEFEDAANQGIGFYARQNGGTLQEYLPHGQGYALFLKGGWGWPEDLGIWREVDGQEVQFATGYDPVPGGLQNGVRYRLRYRVTQHAPDSTWIRARVWPEAQSEPAFWTVEVFDSQPELQNAAGGFALDVYNYQGTGHIFVDDLAITAYPNTVGIPGPAPGAGIALSPPWPHPVSGTVRVLCTLPGSARATLKVFDALGRHVADVFDGPLAAGSTTLSWVSRDVQGRSLPPGAYFLRMQAGSAAAVQRILIVP